MTEHQQQKDTQAVSTTGEKLLRLLAGISPEELNDPEKAARMIERTVRMIAAYIIVAGFALFFLAIPSFVELDGRLHTKNFTAFFWIGSPFFRLSHPPGAQSLSGAHQKPADRPLPGLCGRF